MRGQRTLRLLATGLLAICLLKNFCGPALADEQRLPQDQLFALMKAEQLSRREVEDRFFEVFSYSVDGVEAIRAFRFDLEFLGYSVTGQGSQSIEQFKAIVAEFSAKIGVPVTFKEIEVDDFEAIAQKNPRRHYIMFEPMSTFPTLKTWDEGIIEKSPTNYLPRDVYGRPFDTFPYDQIRHIQEGRKPYRLTCFQNSFHQNGYIVHSLTFLDSSMPAQSQARCMWLILSSATGFRDPVKWNAETAPEYLEHGSIGLTAIDVAAILLAQSLRLKAGTLRTKVVEDIANVWQGDT